MIEKKEHLEIKSARPSLWKLENSKANPIFVLADNIRSLHNVGAIFRTSDAAGIQKLFLGGITPVPPRKEISKTALGAEESVPWEYHQNIIPVLQYFKEEKIPIIALEHTRQSKPFQEFNYSFPLCFVIGNEVEGVSEEIMPYVDAAVDIPMYGIKQSLNVAVAYGIMLFELLRQLK